MLLSERREIIILSPISISILYQVKPLTTVKRKACVTRYERHSFSYGVRYNYMVRWVFMPFGSVEAQIGVCFHHRARDRQYLHAEIILYGSKNVVSSSPSFVQESLAVEAHHQFTNCLSTNVDSVFRVVENVPNSIVERFLISGPVDNDASVYKGAHDISCALKPGSTTTSSPLCSLAYLILLLLGVFFELMAMFSALVVFFVISISFIFVDSPAKLHFFSEPPTFSANKKRPSPIVLGKKAKNLYFGCYGGEGLLC